MTRRGDFLKRLGMVLIAAGVLVASAWTLGVGRIGAAMAGGPVSQSVGVVSALVVVGVVLVFTYQEAPRKKAVTLERNDTLRRPERAQDADRPALLATAMAKNFVFTGNEKPSSDAGTWHTSRTPSSSNLRTSSASHMSSVARTNAPTSSAEDPLRSRIEELERQASKAKVMFGLGELSPASYRIMAVSIERERSVLESRLLRSADLGGRRSTAPPDTPGLTESSGDS